MAAAPAKVLVLVTLYGGNDGLSTVIPFRDTAVYMVSGNGFDTHANQATDHPRSMTALDSALTAFQADVGGGTTAVTTDFRTIYATLLERVLDTDSSAALGRKFAGVNLM